MLILQSTHFLNSKTFKELVYMPSEMHILQSAGARISKMTHPYLVNEKSSNAATLGPEVNTLIYMQMHN